MKKLIAILVVFALAMGAAFAEATVSGAVIGNVNLAGSDTSKATDDRITGSGSMHRVRVEVSGQDDDGKFGGWVRLEPSNHVGYAWWKPIDQFLMRIGTNGGDNFWSKEGVTGYGFQGMAYESVADGGNIWGGSLYAGSDDQIKAAVNALKTIGWTEAAAKEFVGMAGFNFRQIFYQGFDNGLMLEIKPVEMFGINIALPYFAGGEVEDILASLHIQFDLNLDFGNIAITYTGPGPRGHGEKDGTDIKWKWNDTTGSYDNDGYVQVWDGKYKDTDTMGKIFVSAALPIGDNVALDVGISTTLPGEKEDFPINIGAGAKIGITESFGLKTRLGVSIPMDDYKVTKVLLDVLPYFAINDLMTVFVSVGLGLIDIDGEDQYVGFHFNPYLQVGSDWGPKFLVGLKVVSGYADGGDSLYGGDAITTWSIPIAIQASF